MTFGWDIALRSTKRRNSPGAAVAAKIELRRLAARWVGEPRVLDLYAGTGLLWREAWKQFPYHGCDREWFRGDPRRLWVADNLLLVRALDLTRWNVFDLDAYGAPWRLWWILAKRRPVEPNERVAVVFTDGASLRARLGRVERHIAYLAGVPANLEKAASLWPTLVARAVRKLATMHNARLDRLHLASHRNMHYGAALLEGLRENAATASPEEAEEPAP